MAENSKIEWTTHTFNPFRGCTKISPGCTNCYAETLSHRNPKVLGEWGPNGTRVIASESAWREPVKWNRRAQEAGERHRVFCASLADVFEDRPELDAPLQRLLSLIYGTKNLDWLLLTKRPKCIRGRLKAARDSLGDANGYFPYGCETARRWLDGEPPADVWLGVSVENQDYADDRIPELLKTPAKIRFLSVEPLLGPVNLSAHLGPQCPFGCGRLHAFGGTVCSKCEWCCDEEPPRINWVIVGGESGHGARPMQLDWARSIVRQCKQAGVACFVKQLGAAASDPVNGIAGASLVVPAEAAPLISLRLRDKKGGEMDEWPEDLRVREFPNA